MEASWCQALAHWRSRCWFTVNGAAGHVRTRLGVRPGDRVADIFCFGFAVFQQELLVELGAADLAPKQSVRGRALFGLVGEGASVAMLPTFVGDLVVQSSRGRRVSSIAPHGQLHARAEGPPHDLCYTLLPGRISA